jgi:sugar lactone lactonase YvrE
VRIAAEPLVRIHSEVGESALWDHRRGRLRWVDILRGLVHATDPTTGETTSTAVGEHVGAIALLGSDDLLLAIRDGFAELRNGRVGDRTRVVDDPGVRMNDGKADPSGRFVAGSMAYDESEGAGTLFVRESDGAVRVLIERVSISNGVAWSLDGATMYYVDTRTRRIDAFDYDAQRGAIANRRAFVSVPEGDGGPDGITVDADGCVWVALFRGGRVRRYSPTGDAMADVQVPTPLVTSCAFGGAGLDRLFITSASHVLDPNDPRMELAGSVFVADPGCVGRPEPVVPA